MKSIKLISMIAAGTCLIYFVSFFVVFDVFSQPTRTMQHGWIGPAKRHHAQVEDIGGAYEYVGGSYAAYKLYRPLCSAWLKVNGLD